MIKMSITMNFTNRERYCKAINHLFANPDKYKVVCRGRDYGAAIKAHGMECGWYVEFRMA